MQTASHLAWVATRAVLLKAKASGLFPERQVRSWAEVTICRPACTPRVPMAALRDSLGVPYSCFTGEETEAGRGRRPHTREGWQQPEQGP